MRTNQLEIERVEFECLLDLLQKERTSNIGLVVASMEEQRQEAELKCRLFRIREREAGTKPRCEIAREVLSRKGLAPSTGEILYSEEDTQTCLLNSGTTFDLSLY